MKNLKENDFMQEMSMSEMETVNGGWSFEHATIAAATATLCVPLSPAFVVGAFVIGGFF